MTEKKSELDEIIIPRAKRLKRLRNLTNLSRNDLHEKYKININTLKGWEIGRHGGLTEKGAKKIIQIAALEGVVCSLNWLLHGIGEGPKVYEKAETIHSAPNSEEMDGNSEEQNIIDELLLFRSHYKQATEYLVKDESMLPLFAPGDYIAGVKRYKDAISSVIHSNCIVQTKEGQILFRNLRQGNAPDTYTLVCLNLQSDPENMVIYNVELISAAPVIWQRRPNS